MSKIELTPDLAISLKIACESRLKELVSQLGVEEIRNGANAPTSNVADTMKLWNIAHELLGYGRRNYRFITDAYPYFFER